MRMNSHQRLYLQLCTLVCHRVPFFTSVPRAYFIYPRRWCGHGKSAPLFLGKLRLSDIEKTVAALRTFFLAMVLHPEAQRRAQMEIDKVVGTDRLPDFRDEMSLPYVSALVKEVMRWHPVAPIGTPYPTSVANRA